MRTKAFRADRLRQLREAAGLSQAQLAARVGVNVNLINRYENGVAEPSPIVLKHLAKELQVTSDYLLGLVNEQDAHIEVQSLSPDERKFLQALRAGKLRVLLGMLQQAIPDEEEQPDVPGVDVTP